MLDKEIMEKATDKSGYAHNVGSVEAKMDQKKTHEHFYNYHRGLLGMVFGVLFLILLMGIAFAFGRGTNRNLMMRGFGRTTNVEINRSGFTSGMMSGRGMMRGQRYGSGLSGQISNINGDTLTVKDTDGTSYTVNIASTTSIIINNKIDKVSDLKVSAQVVIKGASNSDGSINATIVRSIQ